MNNLLLALLAALLWGGAYGAYFGPELRRWWHRGKRRKQHYLPTPPARPRAARPRPPPVLVRPAPAATATRPAAPASNVIPFPHRPRA